MSRETTLKKGWSTVEINEILRDCMSFAFILEIKRRMKNIEDKIYISIFLKSIAPVLVYEVANSLEIIGIMPKKEFFNVNMNKRVQKERQKFCHKPIPKSSLPSEIQEKMGLNFDEKVYDMDIILNTDCSELLYMNYEIYIEMEELADDFDFWDSLFGMPEKIADIIFSALGFDVCMERLFAIADERISEILKTIESDIECRRYSYSVYKLFSKSAQLSMQDKIFILYRFRLVASIEHLEKLLPDIKMEQDGVCIIDLKAFFRKYKAMVIGILYEDLRVLNSKFSMALFDEIEKKISDKSFFPINRKIRDNIHYSKVEMMSDNEIEIIDRYQDTYINIIKEHMLDELYIDIDEECLTMTGFLEEIHAKGISVEELDKHYVSYYYKYLRQGKL